MLWFVLTFFAVYALIHLYVYFKIIRIKACLPVLVIFYLSPLIWRFADNYLSETFAFWLIFSSLLWMGCILYLAFFTLNLDIYELLWQTVKKFNQNFWLPNLSLNRKRVIGLGLTIIFSLYSYLETQGLEVERVTITTEKIPPNFPKLKILHLSDVHFGPVIKEDKLELIKQVWLKERPDLVVSTGDLVDGNMEGRDYLALGLKKLEAPLGKFAVLGNHEYYRGVEQAVEFTEKAGFKVLRGSWQEVGPIILAGVEDKTCLAFKSCKGPHIVGELLRDLPQGRFVILLKHQPKLEREAIGKFDLMLAGHLHGGLYYPIGRVLLKFFFLSDRGLVKLGNSWVVVSKGVGTGGPPMRFLSSPDVTVIEIVPSRLASLDLQGIDR